MRTHFSLRSALAAALLLVPALALAQAKPRPTSAAPPIAHTGGLPMGVITGKPDYTVTMSPASGWPTQFTVTNEGADSTAATLLKVTATFVPREPANCGSLPTNTGNMVKDFVNSLNNFFECGNEAAWYEETCGQAFPEIVEPIAPLRNGESKSVSRPSKAASLAKNVGLIKPKPASQQRGTHIKEVGVVLVCAWDVTATADAGSDVQEASEGNNAVTRRVYREVKLQ
ncbi:MAG TPA: hypothetical protein PLR87_03650 [Thermoanaerobaculaceae bacterium]|nr:hypothetical protein [Thermoanaerobaculaceae bacterium]